MRRKFLFFTVFVCLFFCFVGYVTASDEPALIYGRVVCGDDIYLSGIEIYIDRYTSDGVGTAVETVKTDEDGYFSFKDPGGSYFGCGIKISSLPYGYGSKKFIITAKSDFYKENGMLFELAAVADVKLNYRGGGLSYSIHDANGDIIYCDIERVDTPNSDYENITYEELKKLEKITYKGQLIVGSGAYDWSGEESISAESVGGKISYLKNYELISDDKYYSLLLDYIEDDYDGETVFCGNYLMSLKNKIREYANQTENTALRERIIELLGTSDEFGFGEIITEKQEDESEREVIEETMEDEPEKTKITKITPLLLLVPCALVFVIGLIFGIIFWKKRIKS